MSELLRVDGVTKHLSGRAVLRSVSFALREGDSCALLGENGAGKSTLLRIVSGILDAERGDVVLCGASLRHDRARALGALGYVPERPDIPEHLCAVEWLDLVAALRRASRPSRQELQALGVGDFALQQIGSLSLGQTRKVAVAAARLAAPRVLALDEPSNGLDAASVDDLATMARRHAEAGGAVLFATHDAAFAAKVATRTVRLAAGAVAG